MCKKIELFFRGIPRRSLWLFLLVVCVWPISSAEAAIKVFSVSGAVEVRLKGQTSWQALQESDRLGEGDHIRSGDDGNAAFSCEDDGSELYLASNSQFAVEEFVYSRPRQQRVFRFKLVKGTLTVNVVQLGFGRYTITEQTLETLRNEGMPETLLVSLKKLAEQEYAEEGLLLAEIKKLIGGRLTVRYKLPVLEYADTGQEVFTLETEDLVVAANYASVVTMIVNEELRQTDVRVERGRFKMHRLNDEGFVRIFGLSNVQAQEGLQFAFNTSGGFARVNVEECSVSSETNVPVSDYYALIGPGENLVSIRNETDSPAVQVIREDEASSVELEADREALFGLPSNRQLSFEVSDFANLSFGFCKQYSSFVFATKGCIEIKGREECCGDVSYTEAGSPDVSNSAPEEREAPPSAETPDSGGGYVPPELPPIEPGSPILPLP